MAFRTASIGISTIMRIYLCQTMVEVLEITGLADITRFYSCTHTYSRAYHLHFFSYFENTKWFTVQYRPIFLLMVKEMII